MKFEGQDITIDDEFPCSSMGAVQALPSGVYEVGYKPEEIPQWFQDLLDELFDGRGVPKEYMAHVRVTNHADSEKKVILRFLLSDKGASYLYPPWWIWRKNTGWMWIPSGDTDFYPGEYCDTSMVVQSGEQVRIASAPYEEPEIVCEKAQQLAAQYDIWTYR